MLAEAQVICHTVWNPGIFRRVLCAYRRIRHLRVAAAFELYPEEVHLAEWHHRGTAGLQLFENTEHAGHGTLTLIVSDLLAESKQLDLAGLVLGPVEPATSVRLMRMNDPDGNLTVLVQPGVT